MRSFIDWNVIRQCITAFQGRSFERVRCWVHLDGIRDWAHLRPLYKLSGRQVLLVSRCWVKPLTQVPLLSKPAACPSGVVCPFLWSLPLPSIVGRPISNFTQVTDQTPEIANRQWSLSLRGGLSFPALFHQDAITKWGGLQDHCLKDGETCTLIPGWILAELQNQ